MARIVCLLLLVLLTSSLLAAPYWSPYIDIVQDGMGFSNLSRWQAGENPGWIANGSSIYTAWGSEWIEYTAFLTPGNWNIGLNVHNAGALDSRYPTFQVNTSINGQTLYISASQNEIYYGYVNVNITQAANFTVRYAWVNDWCSSPYDANIIIANVFFDNTATIPEPSAVVLTLLALSVVGLGYRKR